MQVLFQCYVSTETDPYLTYITWVIDVSSPMNIEPIFPYFLLFAIDKNNGSLSYLSCHS